MLFRSNDTATTEIYTTEDPLSLHDALPIFTARHQAQNAAAALAALDALGLPRPSAVDVDFARWRGDEDELPGGGLLINDAYNANPVSMRAALAYLVERAGSRRRVAILGEMAELGPGAPEFHRQIGRASCRERGSSVV